MLQTTETSSCVFFTGETLGPCTSLSLITLGKCSRMLFLDWLLANMSLCVAPSSVCRSRYDSRWVQTRPAKFSAVRSPVSLKVEHKPQHMRIFEIENNESFANQFSSVICLQKCSFQIELEAVSKKWI